MTIYVDVSAAVHGKAGLSRYAESLVRALEPLLGDRLALFQNSLGSRGPLQGLQAHRTAGVRYGYRPWRALVLASQITRLTMSNLLPEVELFHATEHLLPPMGKVPTVLTVHDLIFERYPEYHKRANYLYLRAAMPLYCRRASAIIAISQSTKNDLATLYGISEHKIHVITEAASPGFVPQSAERVADVRARYGLPERYILAVGTLEPRKNLSRLIDACGPLFDHGTVDALVLVGSRGWLGEEFDAHLAASPWRDRVILPGFVHEVDLPAVYAGATITAQPSLYEGFGLPVLEAMACGSPVCSSSASSLPEVGGEAARYFDPTDVEDMSVTLERVASDDSLRREMRVAGLARAATFSWERTARETLALYEQTIDAGTRIRTARA
ncbi:MAG: glycosyltransferase family 4 protein [Anaerolineae bacterium]